MSRLSAAVLILVLGLGLIGCGAAATTPGAGTPAASASALGDGTAAGSSATADTGDPADCVPGGTTVNGEPARQFCGPATATVTVGSAAPLEFDSGACERLAGTFTVNLGTFYQGAAPKPDYFGVTILYLADGTTTDGPPVVVWTKDGVEGMLAMTSAPTVTIAAGDVGATISGELSGSGESVSGTVTC